MTQEPFKGVAHRMFFLLSPQEYEVLAKIAEAEDRSPRDQARHMLKQALRAHMQAEPQPNLTPPDPMP